MPRYVILEHDHPHLHWDFMIEAGGVLRTWRLAEPPAPGRAVAAEPLPDHRLVYLDYEGPVSGGRGCVKRWDAGSCEWREDGGGVIVRLSGGRVTGTARLAPDGGKWTLTLSD
jgi:surface antigen